MIAQLQDLLSKLSAPASEQGTLSSDELQLATAALLVEVATIDQRFDDTEMAALRQQLTQQFDLSTDDTQALIDNATHASKESSSLYEFTQCVNQHCNDDDKYRLVYGLWSIAYADGDLDKYEEYIIRRIADLIHLRHNDFMRAKHQARK